MNNYSQTAMVLSALTVMNLLIFRSSATTPIYFLNDLGTLGGKESQATGINNLGEVVGSSNIANKSENRSHTEQQHAFLYSHGKMMDLGTLGGPSSIANGINNKGEVVGDSQTSCTYHAFFYSHGKMTDIGTLGSEFAWAKGLNDAGQVVGYSGQQETHAFLYSYGKMTDLGTLGGKRSVALGINNQGQAIGTSMTPSGQIHAFLYSGETKSIAASWGNCLHPGSSLSPKTTTLQASKKMLDLGTLAGAASVSPEVNHKGHVVGSVATGINEKGQVVGTSITANGQQHAFLWDQGNMTDLGTLGGKESTAYGINEKGQVVGTSITTNGQQHAFLWDKGNMTDLNALNINSKGMILNQAMGINMTGQIVGVGTIKNKYHHAFLITPQFQQENASIRH
ncbi:MAG: hypothetical protein NVS2B14_06890 [Chamaesiphon sp.]